MYVTTTNERRTTGSASLTTSGQHANQLARDPIARVPTLVYAASLAVAALTAIVSAVGLASGSLYTADPVPARGVVASSAGVLVPGLQAHDGFNLIVGLPLLLCVVWLAHRRSLVGLLLWPGALFYLLYTYAIYAVGAPFGPLFLVYVGLVGLTACTTIGLVASIDSVAVRHKLAGSVPARAIGGVLIVLALMTVAQDAGGAIATALAGGTQIEPVARRVWTIDLALEVPAVLAGGALLWRRAPLGYAVGAGLLLQFALTPLALAVILALQPPLTGSPMDAGTIIGVLVFVAVCFTLLAFFAHGASNRPRTRFQSRLAHRASRSRWESRTP